MLNVSDQTRLGVLQRKTLTRQKWKSKYFLLQIPELGQSIMAPKKPRKVLKSTPASRAAARRVPMREFSRSLPMSLLRAREAVMRHFRPSLRDHELTEQQWRILARAGGDRRHRGHGTRARRVSGGPQPVANPA